MAAFSIWHSSVSYEFVPEIVIGGKRGGGRELGGWGFLGYSKHFDSFENSQHKTGQMASDQEGQQMTGLL